MSEQTKFTEQTKYKEPKQKRGEHEECCEHLEVKHTQPKPHKTECMRACEWHGAENVKLRNRAKPTITEPRDALIRVTSTTICGSDLHMYLGLTEAMEKGDVLGHEFMGIVEDVGPGVQNFKKGDRVVVSAVIACGQCEYCQKGCFSCCDTTNPSHECADRYGHRLSGVFGYTHLTGGYPGGQAEYVRVPIADMNLLKVPDTLSDDKALLLSDIVCTAWHANEQAEVKEGDVVAVWGCGPVGLLALAWAKFRGARMLIGIDNVPERLRVARKVLGAHTINFDKVACVEHAVFELTNGAGVDAAIETAGFRFPKSFTQKLQMLLKLQTDTSDIVNEQIMCVKKCGHIALIGDYFGYTSNFNIGGFMEKGITMRGGQVFVQKYWKELLGYIESGQFDPTFVITHRMALEDIPYAYRMFNRRQDGMIKVLIDVSPSHHYKSGGPK